MYKQYLTYLFLRILTFPFAFMPAFLLHFFGRFFGLLAYYFIPKYRKRALSNLCLANNLNIPIGSEKKIIKKSFINLAINCLEYSKLFYTKNLKKIAKCINPELAQELYNQKKGIVFFCGHQANWEILFIEANLRMQGIAIGKPIKNPYLYTWITKIREKTGGKIIPHRSALKECLKGLKTNKFIGIVADQGMPESHYYFPFFGRKAWSTTAPALLCYKHNAPLIVATIRREKKIYKIHYSQPIWPNINNSKEEEIKRLMDKCFEKFEKSIAKNPDQWLWQHNRWKQQSPHVLYKQFRYDCILVVLPTKEESFRSIQDHLRTLKKIYPREFLFLLVSKKFSQSTFISVEKIIFFEKEKQMFLKDFRFKMVLNFSDNKKLKRHFLKFSAFDVFEIVDLKKIALTNNSKTNILDLSSIFINAMCRKQIK